MSDDELNDLPVEQEQIEESEPIEQSEPIIIAEPTQTEELEKKEMGSKTGPKNKFWPSDDVFLASHAMANFEFEECRKILNPTKDFCPLSTLLLGECSHIASWTTQSRQEKLNVIDIASKAEKMATEINSSQEKFMEYIKKRTGKQSFTQEEIMNWKAYIKIIIADAVLSRAINQLQIAIYIKAAWNMHKAWKIYESVLKAHTDPKTGKMTLHPEIQDHLKFGVGLFYYIVSLMPGVMLKVLKLIGFVADYEKGIAYMTNIYKTDGLKAPYAMIVLMATYLFMPTALSDPKENLAKVKPIIDYALKTYPNSAMFQVMAAQYERKLGNVNRAIECLNHAITLSRKLNIEPNMYIWDLANCHLMNLDWKNAAINLEKIVLQGEDTIKDKIQKKKDFEFTSICSLQLACCYQLLGEGDKAIKALKLVKNFVSKKGRFDNMALRRSEAILQLEDKSVAMYSTAFEYLYFKRDIAHMQPEHLHKVKEHMSKVDEMLSKSSKKDVIGILSCLIILAAVHNGLNEKQKARELFEKALKHEKDVAKNQAAKHYIVGALYELGEMAFREGDLKRAEEYITRASKYSKYDWDDVYKSRITKALKQLKQKK